MGTKGRDLKVSFLTDLDKFKTDKVADDLDDVADAAKLTGRALDDLGDDAKRELGKVEKSSDEAGDKFKRLAKDADDAFDKIAKSSRASTNKVERNLEDAEGGLGEFKSEADSTTKEVAASFGSVEDAIGGVQELAANAFAGFGPAGAAAGAVAAVGIGLISAGLEKSAEQAAATKQRVIELAQAIDEAGGNLEDVDVTSIMREWSVEIVDNKSWWELWQKSNVTNLERVKEHADAAGVSFTELFKGMSGTDPEAAKRSLDELNTKIAESRQEARDSAVAVTSLTGEQEVFASKTAAVTIGLDEHTRALINAKDELLKKSGVTEEAIRLAALQAEAVGQTAKAEQDAADKIVAAQEAVAAAQDAASARLEEHAAAIDSFADPVTAYTDLLAAKGEAEQKSAEKTASTTKDEKDSWEDYAKAVDVSVGEYLKALERQVVAQEKWATNLQTLAKRGVDEGVLAELERMGPEGAPLVAKLATASNAELTKMVELFGRQGEAAATGVAAGLVTGTPGVVTSAAGVHAAAASQLGKPVEIPVTVTGRYSLSDLERLRNDIKHQIGTIVVPLKPGQSPYANTADNSRYRP